MASMMPLAGLISSAVDWLFADNEDDSKTPTVMRNGDAEPDDH